MSPGKSLHSKVSQLLQRAFARDRLSDRGMRADPANASSVQACAAPMEMLEEIRIAATPVLTRLYGSKRDCLKPFPGGRPVFNPSVVRWGDRFVFVAKSANYRSAMDGQIHVEEKPIEIQNYLYDCDPSLTDFQVAKFDDSLVRGQCDSAKDGIADIRLFAWKQSLWGLGAGIRRLRGLAYSATQILFRISDHKAVEFLQLASPNALAIEKNWMPIVVGDELYFVYSLSPLILYRLAKARLALERGHAVSANDFAIRGGTPFIGLGGKFVAMVHFKKKAPGGKLFYRHAFAVLDENLNLEEISEPFFIQRKGIEFAAGLGTHGDGVIVSYGVSDRAAAYCLLSTAQLRDWIVI